MFENLLIIYVALMSIILFIMMGMDKSKAKKKEWRIAEKTLFTIAVLGGATGGVIGMFFFHHKTKHTSFAFGFPILAGIQLFFASWLIT